MVSRSETRVPKYKWLSDLKWNDSQKRTAINYQRSISDKFIRLYSGPLRFY